MTTARRSLFLVLIALIAATLGCKIAQGGLLAATAAPTAAIAYIPTITPPPAATHTAAPPAEIPPTPSLPPPAAPTEASTDTATAPPSSFGPTIAPTQQQAVFDELWGVVGEQYLYSDFNGLDWAAVGAEYRARIAAGVDDAGFYALMHEAVRRLGDEHSTYFSPAEAAQQDLQFQGSAGYVGIGVLTATVPERMALTVLLVFPGSPAEAAGIRIHDSLLAADGQALIDAEGSRLGLLRGPEGSTVTVTAQSPGEAPRDLVIIRRAVNVQMPTPHSLLLSPGGKRIGYIFVPTFNEINIDKQIGQALSDLTVEGTLDGLILDLRFNGGGSSDVLVNSLSYFIDGPAGHIVERGEEFAVEVRGQSVGGSLHVPLVVLVGKGTASFGEVFAGSLQNLGRAHVIGEVTDGNVEVMSIFNFSDGSRAWIATSTFRPQNPDSRNWEETGIIPDQIVPAQWDQVTLQTDPAVLAALAYFDSLAQ